MNWPGKATGPHGAHPTEGLVEAQVQGAQGSLFAGDGGGASFTQPPNLKALPEKASQLGFDFDFIFVFQAGSGSGNNGINVCKGFGVCFFFLFFFPLEQFLLICGVGFPPQLPVFGGAGWRGWAWAGGGGQEGESCVAGQGGRKGSFLPLGLCTGCAAPPPQPRPLLVAPVPPPGSPP